MSHIFGDLVQRAVLRLSQVGGTSVQTYSEDVLAEMMQHKFTMIFDKRFWDEYTYWTTATLTTEGVVQEDLSDPLGADLDRYNDIAGIYYNTDVRPLRRLSDRVNRSTLMTDHSRPYYQVPYNNVAGKFFQVLPSGSTQQVHIRYRKRPDPFQAEDEVLIDDQILILGTVYDYLEDDDSNPRAAAKFLGMFNDRYDQLINNVNEQSVPLSDAHTADYGPWGVGDHSY